MAHGQSAAPGGLAAAEKVMVTVALVAGPGEAPASVHPKLHPRAVLGTRALAHFPQVPVLFAGNICQLATIFVSFSIRSTDLGLRLATAGAASVRVAGE